MKPETDYIQDLRRRLAAAEAARAGGPTPEELAEAKDVINEARQGRFVKVVDFELVGFTRGGECTAYRVTIETNLPLGRGELEAALRRGFGEVQVTGDDVFLETGRHVHRGRLQLESK